MNDLDAFGRDPQVKYMRRVFARMEMAQDALLKQISMTPYDERLRRFREMALNLFEKMWTSAIHKNIVDNEEDAAALYLYCFSYVLSTRGITVPPQALPENRPIELFVKEVLK